VTQARDRGASILTLPELFHEDAHMRLNQSARKGTTTVECAVVYPLVLLFTLGLVIAAAGVYRYQQLATLARRAARYAVVHGGQYAKETGNPAPTPADIYNNVIAPNTFGLDPSQLSYSITYNVSNYPYQTTNVNGTVVATTNTVTVTLNYNWIPEGFLGGMTLTSTSVMPMSY
jgi:Flp pilus assembly protein TadG